MFFEAWSAIFFAAQTYGHLRRQAMRVRLISTGLWVLIVSLDLDLPEFFLLQKHLLSAFVCRNLLDVILITVYKTRSLQLWNIFKIFPNFWKKKKTTHTPGNPEYVCLWTSISSRRISHLWPLGAILTLTEVSWRQGACSRRQKDKHSKRQANQWLIYLFFL